MAIVHQSLLSESIEAAGYKNIHTVLLPVLRQIFFSMITDHLSRVPFKADLAFLKADSIRAHD